MDNTKIEWCDSTWNPLVGCSRVSSGCMNCYAERVALRFSGVANHPFEGTARMVNGHPTWTGRVNLNENALEQPLRWSRPRRIFVNSMSDLFHENVSDDTIDRIFAVMALAPQHTFIVLTKRPKRMFQYLTWWPDGAARFHHVAIRAHRLRPGMKVGLPDGFAWQLQKRWPLPNLVLGVSAENQETWAERSAWLLKCPAAVRAVSAEPLLGRIDLCEALGMWWNQTMQCFEGTSDRINVHSDGRPRIGWVIAGGESGPGARPMHPDWARALRDQCAAAGVPYFFKQWGEWIADDQFAADFLVSKKRRAQTIVSGGYQIQLHEAGKKAAGRLLDGVEHNGYPRAP